MRIRGETVVVTGASSDDGGELLGLTLVGFQNHFIVSEKVLG